MKTNKLKPSIQISAQNSQSRSRHDHFRQMGAVKKINAAIDAYQVPGEVNESVVEWFVQQWEQYGGCTYPSYWLLTARLFEMALLCAGHYADNCEYTLAGDLLFNPREIEIYQKGQAYPTTKHRHGRLSDQLNTDRTSTETFPDWFKRHAVTRITQPALLPYLRNSLLQSGRMSCTYLKAVDDRLQQACCAIGFLNSWSLTSAEDLHCRLQTASSETRRFVDLHLCHFDTELFNAFGKEIQLFSNNPYHQSKFITNRRSYAPKHIQGGNDAISKML